MHVIGGAIHDRNRQASPVEYAASGEGSAVTALALRHVRTLVAVAQYPHTVDQVQRVVGFPLVDLVAGRGSRQFRMTPAAPNRVARRGNSAHVICPEIRIAIPDAIADRIVAMPGSRCRSGMAHIAGVTHRRGNRRCREWHSVRTGDRGRIIGARDRVPRVVASAASRASLRPHEVLHRIYRG